MPKFAALAPPRSLPQINEAIEHAVMDWKVKPASESAERAKDVAAFANHFGGTILIGAAEHNGQLHAYVGMPPSDAGKVRDDYSKSVADRCSPLPVIDFADYEDPGDSNKRIVAINVSPSLNLVGVKVAADPSKGGYAGPAYVFWIRSGTDARPIEPGQLPMYMTPSVRRIAVMLAKIPSTSTVVLTLNAPLGPGGKLTFQTNLAQMFEEENLAKFVRIDNRSPMHVPIDRILTVFLNDDGKWYVSTDVFK